MNALTIAIRGGWYSVCLDTTYFTENWKLIAENIKKIIFGLLFITENTVQYCSFALMHCSCSMNNARGVGPSKKKKKKKAKCRNANAKIWSKQNHKMEILRGCLVHNFKHMFSVFKQCYTHFYIFFYPHVFSHIFSNHIFLNVCTKHPMNFRNWEKSFALGS